MQAIAKYSDAKIIFTCDVDDNIIEKNNEWMVKTIGYKAKVEKDFRKILENKDVDAVFIATPEHWHAPMAIAALQAGKHVYVEKPCSHNLFENEMLVAAQKKYNKVVPLKLVNWPFKKLKTVLLVKHLKVKHITQIIEALLVLAKK